MALNGIILVIFKIDDPIFIAINLGITEVIVYYFFYILVKAAYWSGSRIHL